MFFLQILSVESDDSSPCLLLSTESCRYLFNCGEGTQRLCVEHKVRLGKVQSIFLTHLGPDTLGGLPGLCLTAADAGKDSITIQGPPGIKLFWKSTQYFMRRSRFQCNILESQEENDDGQEVVVPSYETTDITVYSIPIRGKDGIHICYVCKSPPVPGKFDIQKAQDLKIPKGPMYGQLKSGKSITLEDGSVITPDQVLGKTIDGSCFAVICCISNDDDQLCESLLNNPVLKKCETIPNYKLFEFLILFILLICRFGAISNEYGSIECM